MANSGPIVGGASSAELATRSRRRRVELLDGDRATAGQQRRELVDGRFHREGRIGGEQPVAGGEHRSAQQSHRPGGGECSVVVTQPDRVAGVGHEHLELVVVLGGHVGAEIDGDAGDRCRRCGRVAQLVPCQAVEVVPGDEHPAGHLCGVGCRRCAGQRSGGQCGIDAPLSAAGDQQPDGQQIVAVQLEVAQVAGDDVPATGAQVVGQSRPVEAGRARPPRSRCCAAAIVRARRRTSARSRRATVAPRGRGGPPGCDDGTPGAAATASTPGRVAVFAAARVDPANGTGVM